MKSWIAVNLNDFHSPSKKWQQGNIASVEISVIGARTLEKAKETARYGNDDAWMVFPLDSIKNIAQKEVKNEDDKSLGKDGGRSDSNSDADSVDSSML